MLPDCFFTGRREEKSQWAGVRSERTDFGSALRSVAYVNITKQKKEKKKKSPDTLAMLSLQLAGRPGLLRRPGDLGPVCLCC